MSIQSLSIQKLDFERIALFLNEDKETLKKDTKLASIISRVMKAYEAQKQNLANVGKKKPTAKFKYTSGVKLDATNNFKIRLYSQEVGPKGGKTRFVKQLEKSGASDLPETKGGIYVLFFYRRNPVHEIFALTSGEAWKAVRPCVDYRFPRKVAERILDPSKIQEITRRCLIGSNTKEVLTQPSKHILQTVSALYHQVESFKCYVKPNSSLHGSKVIPEDQACIIKVATGLLRVQKPVALKDYPKLLNLFSQYVRNQKTMTVEQTPTRETTDPLFDFLHFLRPAYVKKEILDKILLEDIRQHALNHTKQTVGFRHKHLNDYLYSNQFEIQYSANKRFVDLPEHPPTIDEILELLLDQEDENTPDDEKILNNADNFYTAFNQASVRFTNDAGNDVKATLIEYLEGEIRDKNGAPYFKMGGMWYKVEGDYHGLLQQDFKNLLKNTLLNKDHEAQLTRPWIGNTPEGHITEEGVKTKIGLTKGIRTLMTYLKKCKVKYVSSSNKEVYQTKLVGDILKNPIIKKHKDKIESELLSKPWPPTDTVKKTFGKDYSAIEKELLESRDLLVEKGKKRYVANPLCYYFKHNSMLKGGKDVILAKYLEEQYELSKEVEDEEDYNRAHLFDQSNNNVCYGPDKGFLVFDQITPLGIEPCDILKYTPTTTYLYPVKQDFGQHTREVCSQTLNAARQIRSALSTHQSTHYIDALWERVISSKDTDGFFANVKKQAEALGKENFTNIFFRRKLVFVYALMETPRGLSTEAQLPSYLTVDDLKKIKDTPENHKKIYEALQKEKFLDKKGRLTAKFYLTRSPKSDPKTVKGIPFKLTGFEAQSIEIFNVLSPFKSTSESTLAKLDLLQLAEELSKLGFELKICEIQKKGRSATQKSTPPTGTGTQGSATSTQSTLPPSTQSSTPAATQGSLGVAGSTQTPPTQSQGSTDSTPPTQPGTGPAKRKAADAGAAKKKQTTGAAPADPLSALPKGLKNIGNSCYINASLQMLFLIPRVKTKIEEEVAKADCSELIKALHKVMTTRSEESLREFRDELFSSINNEQLTNQRIPKGDGTEEMSDEEDAANALEKRKNAQQDADEFIGILLDQLGIRSLTTYPLSKTDTKSKKGRLECHSRISIGITGFKSLQEAINKHFAFEEMDPKDNKSLSQVLGTQNLKQRTILIGDPPPSIIILHLKRFRSDLTKDTTKLTYPLDARVDFPIETKGKEANVKYKILCRINHRGSFTGGHYTADVETTQGLVNYNDSTPSKNVLTPEQNGYILLLQKV